ncbi:5-bromo-4-chloroindolyl phosphate hydrolysis family protein [Niallia sp. Krafla_26]|uniref:5-bromo-4-chloroindolyl phosphate hydrolysis family protein n=1 Tax=Niallia sp. Krafla_26 TaxID=3064703 RepID=UPI003D17A6AE
MSFIKGMVSGGIGAIIFLIFLFLLDIGLLVSVMAGIISFAATLLIFHSLFSKRIEIEVESVHEEYYQNILNEGYEKIKLIQSQVKNIKNPNIQKDGNEILEICKSIFTNLEEDPKDVKVIRQFFTYYLDALLTIFQKYNKIANSSLKGDKRVEIDERMTQNLVRVKELFHSQLKKLLEDHFMDLDTEIQTLNKMMEMEGIRS